MCKELLYVLEGYNHIALFASLDHEIDTTSLLEELLKTDKHIYLPKVVGKDIRFYEANQKGFLMRLHRSSLCQPHPLHQAFQ